MAHHINTFFINSNGNVIFQGQVTIWDTRNFDKPISFLCDSHMLTAEPVRYVNDLYLNMALLSHDAFILFFLKLCFYIAQYPVCWPMCFTLCPLGRPVYSSTNLTSLGSILAMHQLRLKTIHSYFHHRL